MLRYRELQERLESLGDTNIGYGFTERGETLLEAAEAIASLESQCNEAVALVRRWRKYACGQQGKSPFQDAGAFLSRIDAGKEPS